MGYDLYITRAKDWSENEDHQISSEEWLSIIADDDELTLDTNNGSYFANWSGTSAFEEAWFDWFEGNIYTKNPNRAMLGKMLQIANKLNANMQGDDGENYTSIDDFPDVSPDTQTQFDAELSQKTPSYLRKEFIQNIIMFGIIVLLIITVNLLDLW